MAYQPLARKYRPQSFSELVGQEAVVQALGNAITLGRHPPTVIFSGVRGIGKTSSARLYAKALNCEKGPTPNSCNVCESCIAITNGCHEDVMEIDGASNTSVNDIRELQETINYVPQRSRYKIYIIDEVHMLSTAAFNALLKTLEEPPAHVIFVFATTELHKVPVTISSRMPTFFLKKIPTKIIKELTISILDKEGISYEENALTIIAREGHGSARDSLTLLDQAIALGSGEVTMKSLGHLVSNLSSSPYLKCLTALVNRDGQGILDSMNAFDQAGVSFATVAEEVASISRHAFVVKDLGRNALDTELLGLDDGEMEELCEIVQNAKPFDLNRIFRTMVKCMNDLSGTSVDRFIIENYMLEWCFDPGLPNLEDLMNGSITVPSTTNTAANSLQAAPAPGRQNPGISKLKSMKEMAMELRGEKQPSPVAQPAQPISDQKKTEKSEPHIETPQQQAQEHKAAPVDKTPKPLAMPLKWRGLVDAFKQVKPLAARKLEEAHAVEYSIDGITLVVPEDSFVSKSILKPEEQKVLFNSFNKHFGFKGVLKVIPKLQYAGTLEPEDECGDEVESTEPTLELEETIAPVEETNESESLGMIKEESLPDTLLQVKSRETQEKRLNRLNDVKTSDFTQEILAQFGGTIENVIMHEDRT